MNENDKENDKEKHIDLEDTLRKGEKYARKILEYEYTRSIIKDHKKVIKNWNLARSIKRLLTITFIIILIGTGILLIENALSPMYYFLLNISFGIAFVIIQKSIRTIFNKLCNFRKNLK